MRPPESVKGLVLVVLVCWAGESDRGERALAPLLALPRARPLVDMVGPMPYPSIYDLTAEGTRSLPHAMRTGYLSTLDDALIDVILEHCRRRTAPLASAQLRVLGGAMARVPAEATAFAHRDKPLLLAVSNVWENPAEAERHIAWTEAFWREVAPRTAGAYVNYLQDEGEARIRQAYPPATYQRLAEVKRQYDPANLFRGNQNIRPAH